MKISEIQFYRHKTTAAKIRRVYPIRAYEGWTAKPGYAIYGHAEKPYSWAFTSRGKAMAAIFRRIGK